MVRESKCNVAPNSLAVLIEQFFQIQGTQYRLENKRKCEDRQNLSRG